MLFKFASVLALAAAAVATPTLNKRQGISGVISVESSEGRVQGYIGGERDSAFTAYHYTPLKEEALLVSFNIGSGEGGSDIAIVNPFPPNRPFFGAATGIGSKSSNIGPGSSDYQVLAATKHTDSGSSPIQGGKGFTVESAIWLFNPETSSITAQYVNEDLTKPDTFIGLWTDITSKSSPRPDIFILTGDKEAFAEKWGPVQWLTLHLEPLE